MFIKKDSLLLRIISYNGIAIVIVASIMATLFGIMIFNELNMRLLDKSRERTLLVNKAYLYYIDKSREHLYDASTDAVNLVLIDSDDKLIQNRLASAVRNQLSTESYSLYGKSFIQILSPNRIILGESGDRDIKYDLYKNNNIIPSKEFLEYGKFEYVNTKEALYVRIVQPYRLYKSTERNYIVLTFPLTNYSLSEIKEYAYLTKDDKVFILSKDGYLYGELSLDKVDDFFENFKFNKVGRELSDNKYYFSEKKIGDDYYYLGMLALKNDNNSDDYVGDIGVAISKNDFVAIKYMLATIILVVGILAVVISTTLCARIFAKLLKPLNALADKTEKIGIDSEKDKNGIDFQEENLYEIRSISNSLKFMAERIEENEKLLKQNNNKLNTNLNRLVAVEKLLMETDLVRSFQEGINKVLSALTSEVGLGYSRAIYLEYSEEKDELSVKNYAINPSISTNMEKYTKGTDGFTFQINNIGEMRPLLNIKYEPGGIFWDSMESGKIIYHNDKGFKYTYGNKLFKTLGLKNFMILPIADKEMKIGCILVDYFGKDNLISKEEVEVNNLLLMNLLIRIKNAMLEESKLMKERYLTMSKVSNKFIKNNKKLINYVETFIEKLVNNRYNNKDIDKIKRYLRDEKKKNVVIKDSLDSSKNNFEVFNFEKLVEKIVKNSQKILKKYGINTSLFIDFSGNMYGDKKRIYQMFIQILRNSINAILTRNKLDKKINIVVVGDKNHRIILEIIDNGVGMTEEEVKAVMRPYSDTKGNSIMGTGLITIYKIVKEHNGLMTISSELDVGTKIRIIFNEYREETNQ
ncbi:HAMP domain-containing histidine kinase [Fusobacterium animalis]|uniref:histidine kinase n=1 Tax=Fusobacterium animalis 11_3_2 TaxID=457403 RepID=F7L3D7_9FUSO|nr:MULTISPECIES: HAMP domain-containing sensor histidine kinase [Fusobacterium]EGN65049.1 Two component system histidine kinase [Fusobacterium animalis 11_3_2]MCL4585279.1 histidine kinase [Fusobacterium nucleatum YWH7055]